MAGTQTVLKYLKQMLIGEDPCYKVRLLCVGEAGVG